MNQELPTFRYHPNPVATGVVTADDVKCTACLKARGFIYTGPVYAEDELQGHICPWCIADGSAAAKLGASFADSHPLKVAGVPDAVVDEVHLRTPAFVSWQGEAWLAHCADACEFHGDASKEDLVNISREAKRLLLEEQNFAEANWKAVIEHYESGGDPAFYKFICRHCRLVLFGWDCS
ncbi:MAG: CbrC family protein [Panacagrimonas sp.]